MEKDVDLSRRNFLRIGTGALIGGVIAGGIGGSFIRPGTVHAALPGYLPVPTNPLNIRRYKEDRLFLLLHSRWVNECSGV